MIREGIKKKKELRIAICGRNGILGRSANILMQSSSSISSNIPLHVQLNLIEILLDLAKSKISSWDPFEAEILLIALH